MEDNEVAVGKIACTSCGADLKYKSGTDQLTCEYCGTLVEIPKSDVEIEELDFHAFLAQKLAKEDTITELFVKCGSCGASSSVAPNITSSLCPYCSTPLVLEQSQEESIIQPRSLLPFKLEKAEAKKEFEKWVNKLWFAPGDLKKAILNFDHFKAVYIPYWTYDTNTFTKYTGQRGDYYYVTETYTATEDGKTVTKTRQVRKTRWSFTAGAVSDVFDDILVTATKSLPEKYIYKLEPWDLQNLEPFNKAYLSGFVTEKYQIDLAQGFEIAKEVASSRIHQSVCRDIGGDVQRILTMNTQYNDISFKHLLLPVFVSAYRYKEKLYQFLVNGRTGEVQGQRPYSWMKIALTVLGVAAVIFLIALFTQA